MKSLFARMSLPRWVILVCSLGSAVLGTMVYLRATRLDEVQEQLRLAPGLVKDIQTDAHRLSDLLRSADAEKFKAQTEPETYIRATAVDGKVNMGQVDIRKSSKFPNRDIEDNIYTITPQTKTQRFTRAQIGNFLYKLEQDSRRVKVTRLKLTPFGEKIAPGEIGKDQWVFEADLTTRTKLATAPAAAPSEG